LREVKRTEVRTALICSLTALQLCFGVFSLSLASAQESAPAPGVPSPATPSEAPTPPAKPEEKPEEEEKVPPPAPLALPGAPEPEDVLDFQAPDLTVPPDAPGLVDRYQQRLDLIQPGQLLFNLSVEEVYDTNAFNSSGNPQDDFVTVIVPAVAVQQTAKNASLSLRYTPRILKYIRFPELDRVNHTLRFAGSWDPSPGLRLFVRDSLLITDNAAQEASPLGISQPGRRRTTRNDLTPGVEVRLTSRSDLALEYRNVFIDREDAEDRRVNGGRVAWRHRLPRGGVSLEYRPAYVDRERSGNSFNHAGTVRTSYRLNPRNELLLRVAGSFVDNDVGEDTAFVVGDVGLNRQFNPQLRMRLTGGVQVFGLEEGDPQPRFFTDSNLVWTFPRGSLMLGFVQRFQNTFSTVDDVGVVLSTRGVGSFSYQAGPRLSLSVRGSYGRVKFQEQDRTDLVGRVGIDVRYRLWRNLSLTAGYNLFDRNSDVDANDLTTNRVFIGLSLALGTPI
jgi:hypothetical protein